MIGIRERFLCGSAKVFQPCLHIQCSKLHNTCQYLSRVALLGQIALLYGYMSTNIDYWEKVLKNPTPPFKKLFETEHEYLQDHILPNSKVLEIGCGNGRNIQSILKITSDVVGIDNDPQAIKDATDKLHGKNIKILLADALNLPFPEKSFDSVVLLDTLVNFQGNKIKALSEMKRVLNDNGKIVISVYSEDAFPTRIDMYKQIAVPINKTDGTTVIFDKNVGANESEQFSREQIEKMVNEAGLKIVDFQKIAEIAYILTMSR